MKKIFTLFFALFIMVFCAKAQFLLQEGFDTGALPTGWTTIDGDGDGYDWDATMGFAGHSGDCISSASYVNNVGALTPNNWLISPAVTLTNNATLTFWVCAQDASYAYEHYGVYISTTGTDTSNFTLLFQEDMDANGGARTQGAWKQKTVNLASYTGQTIHIAFRHFNCTDAYWLNLDDVEIFAQPTDPTISATATTIDFGAVAMPGSGTSTVTITGYNLTAGITATTTVPFSVSADGTTYGTTATIAANGGTLYLKYAPSTVGTDNGIVTLTSNGATNVTIALTGSAIDCSNNPLPYTTDFSIEAMNDCWTIVDANNDGFTFNFNTNGYAMYSYNEDGLTNANDWLISPVFAIPATGATASFDYMVGSSTYPERYSVYVIANGQTYANASQIVATQQVNNTTWETQYIDLSAYANQSIQIGIKCESDADEYLFGVTNFFVGEQIPTVVTVNPTSIDFDILPAGTTSEAMATITSTNLNEAVTITTAAPYSVSLNGTTYNTTVTIPANPTLSVIDTLYVKFSPTTAGTFNGIVAINATSVNDTIVLSGIGIECNTITTFPFNEDFAETSTTLPCWTIQDANNDGRTFSFYNGAARCQYHSTNPANDWLISPEMMLTGSQVAMFDYWEGSSNYGPERFQVFAINSNGNTALTTEIEVNNTVAETQVVDLSSLTGAYRIGIHCISDPDVLYLYIDNFSVASISEASLSVNPDSISFSGCIMGQPSAAEEVAVTGLGLTGNISVTAPASFEVSTDNTTFGTTATIVASGVATQATLYVRLNAATAGTHSGNITLTSGTATATIYAEGTAVDCTPGIATLPFTHNFNDGVVPPICWDYDDASHFGVLTVDETTGDYAATVGMVDYLITPEIHTTAAMNMSIDYMTYACMYEMESDDPTSFRIGYSTTNNTYSSFTWLSPVTANEMTGAFTTYTATIPAGAKFIAIDVTEIGTFYYGYLNNYIYFDNFSLTEINEPTISTSTTSIDFGTVNTNTTETETVIVVGAALTANITATTAAPFEVSADNTTFGTTATIPATGGNLYVRYAPTTAGTHNGNVALTSGTASASITVTGFAIDCAAGISSLPFLHDFNDGIVPPYCWNYDNENYMGAITIEEGDYAAAFAAPAYLITPEIHNNTPINFSIDYQTLAGFNDISSSSTFRVGYSSTTDDYSNFTWFAPVVSTQTSANFFNYTQVLPAGTKYVALDVTEIGIFTYGTSSYYNYMILDNLSLTAINNPEISANTNAVNFGNVNVNTTAIETVTVTGALLTANITATTAAPFEVSADNITFGTTATLPVAGGNLYVRYAPTAAGNHTGNLTLASTGANPFTISLTGRAFDCSAAATLPFVEDFENGLSECWTLIDADGDGHNWEMKAGPSMSCHSGEGVIASASYDGTALSPDNWLITPAINLTGDATMTFWVVAQDASYAAEHYGVYISTTGTEISNFTELYQETIDANGGTRTPGTWKQKTVNLSAYSGQNVHIAFRHFNCYDMFWLNIDDIEITSEVGIANVDNTVSVYPNPANSYINVNANSNISNVEIYTIAGQKVGDFTANSNNTSINTSNLTSGLYLMQIHTENGVINKKFSVVR